MTDAEFDEASALVIGAISNDNFQYLNEALDAGFPVERELSNFILNTKGIPTFAVQSLKDDALAIIVERGVDILKRYGAEGGQESDGISVFDASIIYGTKRAFEICLAALNWDAFDVNEYSSIIKLVASPAKKAAWEQSLLAIEAGNATPAPPVAARRKWRI